MAAKKNNRLHIRKLREVRKIISHETVCTVFEAIGRVDLGCWYEGQMERKVKRVSIRLGPDISNSNGRKMPTT